MRQTCELNPTATIIRYTFLRAGLSSNHKPIAARLLGALDVFAKGHHMGGGMAGCTPFVAAWTAVVLMLASANADSDMSMPMAATPVPAGVTKTAFVCPDVPRASKHFTLTVTKYNLTLPDGRKLPQLAYNRSVVGPAIVLNLGDEVSIDLRNELGNTGA